MAWTSPKTWAVNDIFTAADCNTYIRDNSNAIGKLTAYTPVWNASTTNPTIGNGLLQGRYIALEEWCWCWIAVNCGSTTTGGSGVYTFTLPFTASALLGGTEQTLMGSINQLGVSRSIAEAIIFTGGTTCQGWVAAGSWTHSSPFTFAATGNTAQFSGIYRRV